VRVRVYFGESDHHGWKQLWAAFLDYLRREGASGATVTRAMAGYGAHSRIHAATLVDLSADLPLVLEWVDDAATVDRLLPGLVAMLDGGLVTTDPVDIVRYTAHAHKPRDRTTGGGAAG
jgi:PII-like signaling protein